MDRRFFLASSIAAIGSAFVPTSASAQTGPSPTGYLRTNWSHDPYSYGSYSFFARGSARRHARDLARPIEDTVFFAGEATHPQYNSTVHAAYESGILAADAVAEAGAQQVCIVGAGMSGLAAAARLQGLGHNVTVLEARNDVGGRIRTNRDLSIPLDLGASWIHGDINNPLVTLAQQQQLRTVPTSETFIVRGAGGVELRGRDVPRWLNRVATIQHGAGASLNEINVLAYALDRDHEGEDLMVAGGYDQLLQSLATDLDLRLNWQVSEISHAPGSATIRGAGGERLTFDAVVVTLPLGVLKAGAVAFDPPLPSQKRTAIRALGMGVLDKVYLRYRQIFWDADTTWILTPDTGLPQGQFNQWLNLYPYTGEPVIMAFNGGQPARDLSVRSDSEIVGMATSVLARTYA